MPVEEQVVQIFAATNGYVDRINVDRVTKFLTDLSEAVRGNEPELLKKIAGGDWSDETQAELDKFVAQYAEDFGYDLDEEGLPLEDGDEPPARHEPADSGSSGGTDSSDQSGSSEGSGGGDADGADTSDSEE
jgi:F-type H+-transporting ATPase subunit alpha